MRRIRVAENVPPHSVRDAVRKYFSSSQRAWIWPLLVAATIFLASSRSQIATPSITNFDKVAHFSVYGLLATLVVRLRICGRWAPWLALVLVSFYGVTDEFHQSFVPGRSCDVADWIADTSGAALAILLYSRWTWYRQRLEMPVRRNRRIENSAPLATISGHDPGRGPATHRGLARKNRAA